VSNKIEIEATVIKALLTDKNINRIVTAVATTIAI
jgi:hypothetical protein